MKREKEEFPIYQDNQLSVQKALSLVFASVGSVVLFIYLQKAGYNPMIVAFINILVPLTVLIVCLKDKMKWLQLFKKIHVRDIVTIIFTVILLKIVSIALAWIQVTLGLVAITESNPLVTIIEKNTNGQNLLLLGQTAIELVGEELITIIPFLALLFIFVKKVGLTRRTAIMLSWFLTAFLFGALHLSTYHWNVFQALIGIGLVRLVLTYPYIKTKNLWVSSIVHIANDWSIFIPIIIQHWK